MSSDPTTAAPTSAPPVMVRKKSRRLLWLALFGVLVAGGAVAAYLFWKGSRADAAEMTRKLPSGMQIVGGADLHRLLENDWVKRIVENPLVKMSLGSAKNQFGVDVLALDAVAGGVKIEGGKIHGLFLVVGTFEREKLEPWLKKASSGDIDVGGKVFQRFAVGEALIPPERPRIAAPGPEGAPLKPPPPPLPQLAPMAMGFLDDHTFVAGSPDLIESYAQGGGEPTPEMKALLDKIDPEAVGWGVGVLAPGLGGAFPLMAPVAEGASPDGVAGASFVYQVKLTTAFEMTFELTLPSEALAKQVAGVFETGMKSGGDLLTRLAGLGKDAVKPDVQVDGKTIRVLLNVPLPKHDEIGK